MCITARFQPVRETTEGGMVLGRGAGLGHSGMFVFLSVLTFYLRPWDMGHGTWDMGECKVPKDKNRGCLQKTRGPHQK